ncbi:hypothetical protein Tco_1100098 [Tanacetum coccineum]
MSVEEQGRLLMEFIAARKKFFAAKRTEEQRNNPPTKAEQRKKISGKSSSSGNLGSGRDTLTVGKISSSGNHITSSGNALAFYSQQWDTRTRSSRVKALMQSSKCLTKLTNSVKKHKVEDDVEKAELKACLEIVPNDDIAVNIESLAIKYPIVDWKTHILVEDIINYQIIRADGSTKNYKIFSAMLYDFDRQDVLDLYRLVDSWDSIYI